MFSGRYVIVCGAITASLLAGCATTQTGGPAVDSGAVVVKTRDVRAAVVFGDSDRRMIRDYYRGSHKALPPGLAKKSPSHPGLRHHIEKFGRMPPGIGGNRLPLELERRLRSLPDGYVRLLVDGDVLLMNERTRYVLDMIFDVQ